MAHPNSIFKKWLIDTLEAEPEYPYHHSIKLTNDIKVEVYKQFGYDPVVLLLAKDSLSIAFGEYECNLTEHSIEEMEQIVEEFYNDARDYGIDQAIAMNVSLWK